MIVCVDVDYRAHAAVAACVGFRDWSDAAGAFERAEKVSDAPAPYVPGSFYLRELPCVRAILDRLDARPDVIVIDGYVSLATGHAGLGEHLHRALDRAIPIVGVAKTAFAGATHAARVLRGKSAKSLFVTAIGMSTDEAAANIRAMHGDHRVPTLLARADRLCRDYALT